MVAQVDPFINRGIPKDLFMEIQEGRVPGHRIRHKFGRNENVGTTLSTVTCNGAGVIPKLTVPGPFYFSSTSPLDALGSTGAEAVRIEGIKADYEIQTEVLALNGTTLVPTVGAYIGFPSRLEVVPPGSTPYPLFDLRQAEGVITSYADAGATIALTKICPITGVAVSNNESLIAADFVPSNEVAFLYGYWIEAAEGKSIEVVYRIQTLGSVMKTKSTSSLYRAASPHIFAAPLFIPSSSLIEFQALSSGGGVDVTVSFEMVLVDNDFIGTGLAGGVIP